MIRNIFLNSFLLSALLILLFADVSAQTSTISGTVIDADVRYTLPGAYVSITTAEGFMVPTDIDGRFSFADVPIGRHVVKITFMGYESCTIDGIVVVSGRPVVLEIQMNESVVAIAAAEITATKAGEVMNEMATVSARAFTVEETNRYAGSRGDPARMASNFAGVQGADDSRNDIVVRGNSPSGVLWRIEGVDLPNPNHFSVPGTGGGPVAIINNKTLANSDFFTAAFPAEFGNSTAAVFDLKLRNGNQDHLHGSVQLGFLGTEVLAEGPLSRKKRSSFLINYRYSTASIFNAVGIDIGTSAVPKYQDGSFKLFTPTKGGGSLSLWGIGGNSSIDIVVSDQLAPERNIYGDNDRDQYFQTAIGMVGLTHTQPLNTKTYIKTTLAFSRDRQDSNHDYVTRDLLISGNDTSYTNVKTSALMTYGFVKDRVALAVHANRKLETTKGTATLRMGLNSDLMMWSFQDRIRSFTEVPDSLGDWRPRWDADMSGVLIQPFIQVKRRPNDALTWTAGVHSMFDTRSGAASWFEPRLGMQWVAKSGTVWSAGSGLHSQIQSAYIYASATTTEATDQLNMPNQELGFTRSLHNVIGVTRHLSDLWTLKMEAYHQHLFDIPVADMSTAWGADNGSYSLINAGGGFSRLFPDTLLNEGTGRNIGVEMTISRAFREGWFVLFTASVFDAQYKGADGVSRNTDFNGGYSWNFLASKEWKLTPRLGLVTGLKSTMAGGRWYGPVDEEASLEQREIIFIDDDRNTLQFDDYFRLDLKTNLTWNRPETTHELGIDFVNVLAIENILKLTYAPDEMDIDDPNYSPVREEYQLGFLPIFFYRIDF